MFVSGYCIALTVDLQLLAPPVGILNPTAVEDRSETVIVMFFDLIIIQVPGPSVLCQTFLERCTVDWAISHLSTIFPRSNEFPSTLGTTAWPLHDSVNLT
jgi:hypothetical protein